MFIGIISLDYTSISDVMKIVSKYYMPLVLLGLLMVIGVSVICHNKQAEETVIIEDQVLERAYQDVITEEVNSAVENAGEAKVIKVFGADNELIDVRVLKPEELADRDFNRLMNQSTLIAEYKNSLIYKVKD